MAPIDLQNKRASQSPGCLRFRVVDISLSDLTKSKLFMKETACLGVKNPYKTVSDPQQISQLLNPAATLR